MSLRANFQSRQDIHWRSDVEIRSTGPLQPLSDLFSFHSFFCNGLCYYTRIPCILFHRQNTTLLRGIVSNCDSRSGTSFQLFSGGANPQNGNLTKTNLDFFDFPEKISTYLRKFLMTCF